jgi:hypothetical protein
VNQQSQSSFDAKRLEARYNDITHQRYNDTLQVDIQREHASGIDPRLNRAVAHPCMDFDHHSSNMLIGRYPE